MCGIFGLVNKNSGLNNRQIKKMSDLLFKLSESRGKEAAGIAFLQDQKAKIYKDTKKASVFIKNKKYADLFERNISTNVSLIGHDRLVTNGESDINNQPVAIENVLGVHNGIIVNVNDLWKKFDNLERKYQIDTEILFALINKFIKSTNDLTLAVQKAYQEIDGYASIALFFKNFNYLLLATNNGSLYTTLSRKRDLFVFASEYYILDQFIRKQNFYFFPIKHLSNNKALLLDLNNLEKVDFDLLKELKQKIYYKRANTTIKDLSEYSQEHKKFNIKIDNKSQRELERHYMARAVEVKKIKRCSKCVLPETMPFINYDKDGVCNYCRDYKKIKILGRNRLEKDIQQRRRANARFYDSMLMFSGGRDSCYALHYLKKELKLNPVAYSYDWGMLTDLGRRNQSRMCERLGIEHIIISADIRKKRANIKRNILAWLKKPNLGMIPLFMAGDKQFFYYANKLKRNLGIELIFQGSNPYEKTDFKYGFSGVKTKTRMDKNRKISLVNRLTLPTFYLKEFLFNLSYLNLSLLDTSFAYLSYYLAPRDYFGLFRYIEWNENEVNKVLLDEYDWETASDSATTWRIGDGTAAFYNYIYYMVAGFTENDTFRSNQIREGVISREEALEKIEKENYPRWQAIRWYCDTIDLDFQEALSVINGISALY